MSSSDDDTPLVRGRPNGGEFARTSSPFVSHSTEIFARDALRDPDRLCTHPHPRSSAAQHRSLYSKMANHPRRTVKSEDRISKSVDQAMDKQIPSNGHVEPGVSVRMGPIEEMDVDTPPTNGNVNGKRKARSSLTNGRSYKEESSSEDDDKPLVRSISGPFAYSVR